MTHDVPDVAAAEIKQCCALAYGSDWATLLIGDSLHPGGNKLTDRLADLLEVTEQTTVLDVAAGKGASALHLAATRGCKVLGVDLSEDNVAAAAQAAAAAGLESRVDFRVGDAERLPVDPQSFDAVICECALCTFPDKAAAVAEFCRVLRDGGGVGIADLVRRGPLPRELDGLLAWVACIADALPVDEYISHLRTARLTVETVEEHDAALLELGEAIRFRLLTGHLLAAVEGLSLPALDWPGAARMARSAIDAIRQGKLGYALICARSASQ